MPLDEPVSAPATPQPTLAHAREVAPAPSQKFKYSDGTDPLLLAARDDILQDDLHGAIRAYQHMIERGRLVNEILPDLARLAQKHPRDPLVWQTLGDALSHAGDKVHAAESYERARRLRG